MNIDEATKDTPLFSLKGLITNGKVVSVYDGDTCKIVFPFENKLYKWNCRLMGIDTPEMKTKDEKEKQFATHVRDFLRDKMLDKIVNVECLEFEKYGRLLVNINIIEGSLDTAPNIININKLLIEKGYAFEYLGKKKRSWTKYLQDKDIEKLK